MKSKEKKQPGFLWVDSTTTKSLDNLDWEENKWVTPEGGRRPYLRMLQENCPSSAMQLPMLLEINFQGIIEGKEMKTCNKLVQEVGLKTTEATRAAADGTLYMNHTCVTDYRATEGYMRVYDNISHVNVYLFIDKSDKCYIKFFTEKFK